MVPSSPEKCAWCFGELPLIRMVRIFKHIMKTHFGINSVSDNINYLLRKVLKVNCEVSGSLNWWPGGVWLI